MKIVVKHVNLQGLSRNITTDVHDSYAKYVSDMFLSGLEFHVTEILKDTNHLYKFYIYDPVNDHIMNWCLDHAISVESNNLSFESLCVLNFEKLVDYHYSICD